MSNVDRVSGAIVGTACGDALGAGYEFGPPLDDGVPVLMKGGGTFDWAPGEWTDDTSMAVAILEVMASGRELDEAALDTIVARWLGWAADAPDVGVQTCAVFGDMSEPTAAASRAAARSVHEQNGRSAGNGSLMRTAPVALGFLADGQEARLADVARAVSDLTHFETDAGDACVLWSLAIRHAIRTGIADVRVGLAWLPEDRRERWAGLIAEAETKSPRDFDRNGWVVEALQAAWSAIHHGSTFVDVVERAVRGGRDTDTVAAIAGGLKGAAVGISAIPDHYLESLHGWPGWQGGDLVTAAVEASSGWIDRA